MATAFDETDTESETKIIIVSLFIYFTKSHANTLVNTRWNSISLIICPIVHNPTLRTTHVRYNQRNWHDNKLNILG